MSPSLISLIITLVAVLIIGIQVIFGAIRGLKKSVFRLVWIFLWGIICLFASSLIAKALVNIDISFLNLQANGESVSTFPMYIQKTIEASSSDAAQMMADNPELVALCTNLAICILNLVFFEILFWLTKWLLYPIWAIISAIVFKKNKKTKNAKAPAYRENVKKPQKHGFLGMIVGLATGLVVALFAFMPLSGISRALVAIETETTVEYDGATQKGAISQYAGEYAEYLYVYEDSIINKAFTYTGLRLAQNFGSDTLTTTSYNGQKISLQGEISNFAPVYVDYSKITAIDLENIQKNDIETILPLADDMQKRILSSNIVKSVYNELAPYLAKNIVTNDDYFIQLPKFEDEELNTILKDSFKAVFGINESGEIVKENMLALDDLSADISKMIDVVKKLNDADIAIHIVDKDISLSVIKENISNELVNGIIDNVFDTSLAVKLVPVVVEPGIEKAIELVPTFSYNGEDVKVEYVALTNGITANNLKNFSKSIASDIVEILKNIDENSRIYIKSDNFSNFGAILDKLSQNLIISSQTFDSALNYGIKYVNSSVDSSSMDDSLKDIVKILTSNVVNIESFETELGRLGEAYKIYDEVENLDALSVAKMMDKISKTKIYTDSLDELLPKITNLATQYITDNNIDIDTTDISEIVNTIREIDNFEEEYNKIKPALDFITENESSDLLDDENLVVLGQKLDIAIANQSKLLSLKNCKLIAKSLFKGIELPDDIKNITVDDEPIKDKLLENIESISSFENEMKAVVEVKKITNLTTTDKQKFVDMGEILDNVKSSNLFGNLITPIVKNYINTELQSYTIDDKILPVINSIKNNISNQLVYKNEFGYLYDMLNANFDNISAFKTFLQNNLIEVYDDDGIEKINSKSELITTDTIYDIVIKMIDDVDFEGVDIKTELNAKMEFNKSNKLNIITVLTQIESLKTEFENLKNVPDVIDIDREYLTDIGKRIDRLSSQFNLIINNSAQRNIGEYVAGLINDNVQEQIGILAPEKAGKVQATYNDIENYTSFETMFTKFADDLELA